MDYLKKSMLNDEREKNEGGSNSQKGIKAEVAPIIAQRIPDAAFSNIRTVLTTDYSELVWRSFSDDKAKEDLREVLATSDDPKIRNFLKTENQVEYFMSELVGLGVFETLIREPGVTDIGFNGTDLVIQTNSRKYIYEKPISEDYINKIIVKMAHGIGKSFTPKDPVFDGVFGNYRINAVHRDMSPQGTTMSLRVSHKKMMLNKGNFQNFAPMYVYDLLESLVISQCNLLISGQTGTGKTELQKLLVSFIPFSEKVIVIEDVQEMHVKEMFPEKDIISWVTGPKATIANFVKISLRNNPEWVIVSETRGSEAYEMFQAVLSGSYIITTLHAPDAHKVPDRFVNMITDEYQNANEERLERNILENFNIGIHIEYVDIDVPQPKGMKPKMKRIRYASEIVEYNLDGIKTLFKQSYIKGKWVFEPQGDLSDYIKQKFLKAGLDYTWGGERLSGQNEEKEV